MPKQNRIFVACILALVAVAFGFVIRAFVLTEWGAVFNLSESQKGLTIQDKLALSNWMVREFMEGQWAVIPTI